MSATTCNVRGKQSDGMLQKIGPMKATIPMSSLLRPLNNVTVGTTNTCHFSITMSPPMRLISPDHNGSGHRSPGSINYSKGKSYLLDGATLNSCIRRTVSLDALVSFRSTDSSTKPSVNAYSILQLDKATQTDDLCILSMEPLDSMNDAVVGKSEKNIRHRIQRVSQRSGEPHTNSQLLSPMHTSPVSIPIRSYAFQRPMRNSIEGLNQEIEKLVLIPGQPHTCRPESSHFARGLPEGHRAPLADILHNDTRSVNTQTPNRELLSSDESQSTSPDDGGIEASPRINRFLARLPPDGCEKVSLKSSDIEHMPSTSTIFKPQVGFKLRPSLGSAFQPISTASTPTTDTCADDTN